MPQLTTVTGDLLLLALQGEFDVIIHGCNCQCQMGKGIALSIKRQFPEAYQADLRTPKGDPAKLGTISVAEIVRPAARFTIVNGYTQLHWRGEGVKADYDAIARVMRQVKQAFSGQRIAYPKIGAGLAGGDWASISGIIADELQGEDHTYVEFLS
ncbi:O-acetyl-ADP-ribose deacetylase (regulator of RNase III), contains Macro domain [Andreprevotia lacus DSM 23236]|jgi:O-acetyl-ADP-ribose deacetylase (regulator of RNase III)|uniref:O-acetyl-ADP-ribose deacetylase (Regulator of RNase III), contains Macro domain n=1 Tax=Andreprevotia lacus DSM 23236 TaxID=1121001 RepID=A0A1W1Y0C4_9NEIS|nr:macro domain-containing protein [Andreprevotia lacus]SMC29613.1 O-acetyl-ADP-ribose deacetylase (regulator of RNase III), contains Macro domain [Andreprevotia lacus DSM 23236]